MMRLCVFGAVFSVATAAAARPKSDKILILVRDLDGSLAPEQRAALSASIPRTLARLGRIEAYTFADIQRMVAVEETRQLIGCKSDAACLSELAGAFGAAYSIAGRVTESQPADGDSATLQLELYDNAHAKITARVERTIARAEIAATLDTAVQLLVRDLLAASPATVAIGANIAGARVHVDGKLIGTTPVRALVLAGGMHTFEIEGDGVVRQAKDLDIPAAANVAVQAALPASPDRLRAYVAVLATGFIVAAGAATAITALQVTAQPEVSALRRDLAAYNARVVRTDQERTALSQREAALARFDVATVSLAVTGAAALACGLGFAIAYAKIAHIEGRLDLDVSAGPASLGLHGRF